VNRLDEQGTLYFVWDGQRRKLRSGSLRTLLSTAMQGHEGRHEDMVLELDSGVSYAGVEIRTLSSQRGKKRWYWPF